MTSRMPRKWTTHFPWASFLSFFTHFKYALVWWILTCPSLWTLPMCLLKAQTPHEQPQRSEDGTRRSRPDVCLCVFVAQTAAQLFNAVCCLHGHRTRGYICTWRMRHSSGSRPTRSLIGHGRRAAGARCLWCRPAPYRHFNPLYVRLGLSPLLYSGESPLPSMS